MTVPTSMTAVVTWPDGITRLTLFERCTEHAAPCMKAMGIEFGRTKDMHVQGADVTRLQSGRN